MAASHDAVSFIKEIAATITALVGLITAIVIWWRKMNKGKKKIPTWVDIQNHYLIQFTAHTAINPGDLLDVADPVRRAMLRKFISITCKEWNELWGRWAASKGCGKSGKDLIDYPADFGLEFGQFFASKAQSMMKAGIPDEFAAKYNQLLADQFTSIMQTEIQRLIGDDAVPTKTEKWDLMMWAQVRNLQVMINASPRIVNMLNGELSAVLAGKSPEDFKL